MKTRVVNLYGGPGTGKSTTAAALFAELKFRGVNCEYIQEYAKDKAWEFSNSDVTPKVLEAQEYIFGKQHFRLRRCAKEVDLIITDSPLLLNLIYTPDDFPLPSLRKVVKEAYDMYDNLDIFLTRTKLYNPKGRFQTEQEAKLLDLKIKDMLNDQKVDFYTLDAGRDSVQQLVNMLGY